MALAHAARAARKIARTSMLAIACCAPMATMGAPVMWWWPFTKRAAKCSRSVSAMSACSARALVRTSVQVRLGEAKRGDGIGPGALRNGDFLERCLGRVHGGLACPKPLESRTLLRPARVLSPRPPANPRQRAGPSLNLVQGIGLVENRHPKRPGVRINPARPTTRAWFERLPRNERAAHMMGTSDGVSRYSCTDDDPHTVGRESRRPPSN